MGQTANIDDTRRKLDDLGQRITAAKSSIVRDHSLAGQARKDWDDMIRSHAEIRRRLDAAQSSQVVEGVRLDIDVLRNSFERWVARVEGSFTNDRR
jgi:head-tail adaptor